MKFLIHTYGCQMNVRDSEAVEALMLAAGHEKAANEDEAEIVVVNSCTVRQKAEEKAVGKAGNLIAARKITGMMGCAVKRMGADIFARLPKLDFAVGPRRFGLIPHIVDRIVRNGERGILELGDDEVPTGMDAHPDVQRAGTTTATVRSAQSAHRAGVASGARRVETLVIATESATSPFAR